MQILGFIGSVRDSKPPRPARVGQRVGRACRRFVEHGYPEHELVLIDPLDYDRGPVFKPHFAYAKDQAPADLDGLAAQIEAADAYVMISPEYNHSMSPALADLLNHFGSSRFAYKPSLIVTYSAGQWGGTRAGVVMRGFLSELGCLPVSAMIQIPHAGDLIDADGRLAEAAHQARWQDYAERGLAQLVWWAEAAAEQRQRRDPHADIGDFTRDPGQRDAPATK